MRRAIWILVICWVAAECQTRINEDQVRLRIRVVEWAKCQASGVGTNSDGSTYIWDCNGLEMYRFQLSDGTIRGPFIAVAAGADFSVDAKWVRQVE